MGGLVMSGLPSSASTEGRMDVDLITEVGSLTHMSIFSESIVVSGIDVQKDC
jgi:hypothetical protein